MRHVIETGTDVAVLCFFDPAALPPSFDTEAARDLYPALERSQSAGRLQVIDTGADGAYLFHFYVEEGVPAEISKFCEDPREVPRLEVPSGRLVACGAEYAASDPFAKGLSKYPHMGGQLELEPGDYSGTVWLTDYPDDYVEGAIAKALGEKEDGINPLFGIGLFLGVPILGLAAIFQTIHAMGEDGVPWGAILLWVLLVTDIALLRKVLSPKRPENPRKAEIEKEYPSIVVQLKRLA